MLKRGAFKTATHFFVSNMVYFPYVPLYMQGM